MILDVQDVVIFIGNHVQVVGSVVLWKQQLFGVETFKLRLSTFDCSLPICSLDVDFVRVILVTEERLFHNVLLSQVSSHCVVHLGSSSREL